MTGFARSARENEAAALAWELRSVNGRGLEVRLRLPPGMEQIEQQAKSRIQKRFARGGIQANLAMARGRLLRRAVIDEKLLAELAETACRLCERHGAAPPTADGLLALRGVMEVPDAGADEQVTRALEVLALEALDEAVEGLAAARLAEGRALGDHLAEHLDQIEALVLRAEADPSRGAEAIREKLVRQVRLLTEASPPLDEARLHQEAAILATKADISEEIDRLKTHVAAARRLVREGAPVGRKLDFLAQELNRESNTLCSKSNAASVTSIGLELKVVVDRFREQVQNLE